MAAVDPAWAGGKSVAGAGAALRIARPLKTISFARSSISCTAAARTGQHQLRPINISIKHNVASLTINENADPTFARI